MTIPNNVFNVSAIKPSSEINKYVQDKNDKNDTNMKSTYCMRAIIKMDGNFAISFLSNNGGFVGST